MTLSLNNAASLRFIKYWLPVIIYAIFIFYLSSFPGTNLPKLFVGQDILFHIIEYTFLALLISRALKTYQPNLIYTRRVLLVFLISLAYAVSDEFHQIFVSGRCASGLDILIDGIGSCIGSIFYPWRR